jgi:hypothetical protein
VFKRHGPQRFDDDTDSDALADAFVCALIPNARRPD